MSELFMMAQSNPSMVTTAKQVRDMHLRHSWSRQRAKVSLSGLCVWSICIASDTGVGKHTVMRKDNANIKK